ncbi:MAG: YidC/Oxa1 family membrane protein insertase [Nocardioides sp.]
MKELQIRLGEAAQKTMELYRESGTNPFASCLPLILQMTISLFRLINLAAHGEQRGISPPRTSSDQQRASSVRRSPTRSPARQLTVSCWPASRSR